MTHALSRSTGIPYLETCDIYSKKKKSNTTLVTFGKLEVGSVALVKDGRNDWWANALLQQSLPFDARKPRVLLRS
jgi:hypothetical protein